MLVLVRRLRGGCACSVSVAQAAPLRPFGARASRRRGAAAAAEEEAAAAAAAAAQAPPHAGGGGGASPVAASASTAPAPAPYAPPATSDLLTLAASLLREHGGSLEPSLLKSRMRDAWAGAPGAAGGKHGLPSGIAFVRQFPSVFSIEWGVRRLGGDAVAEFERFARRVRLNEGAPVQLLERASAAAAEPALYGPILEEVLRRAGGYLPLRALTLRLQMAALERGARLPPPGVNWFILHPSPHYARLRPVWCVGRVRACGSGARASERCPPLRSDAASLRTERSAGTPRPFPRPRSLNPA